VDDCTQELPAIEICTHESRDDDTRKAGIPMPGRTETTVLCSDLIPSDGKGNENSHGTWYRKTEAFT
jgi:hypothetical protein